VISAVDTNVLLDMLRPNPEFVDASLALLENASEEGTVVICSVVYSELSAHFEDQSYLDQLLVDSAISVEDLTREAAFEAGRIWVNYRSADGKRSRIIPDFLIGAHASVQASRLLTRDRGFYRQYFPGLIVQRVCS
jgi:predicted nucleic acid-binding protein